MAKAFSPGHITCFFGPAGSSGDPLSRGSIGAGIRTALGATVEVVERSGTSHRIMMDGVEVPASVTEALLSRMAPGRVFDVTIENQLPCSEGFGMSAAGATAAALCLADILGMSRQEAFEHAHLAEIIGGGGLGDVSAISCPRHQPVRVRPGIPPYGEVVGTDVCFDALSLVVLGPKMHTGHVLGDSVMFSRITLSGREVVEEYIGAPSEDALFSLSNRFSSECGLESCDVSDAMEKLGRHGFRAAMCMLGNSIFTEAPPDLVKDVLGVEKVYATSSTDECARLIRKG
ncbi:MAG: pantothenate kinase [archaeon]|nr:pantothenate kinase [archaeon]